MYDPIGHILGSDWGSYKMRKCKSAKVNMYKMRKWNNAKVVRKCV